MPVDIEADNHSVEPLEAVDVQFYLLQLNRPLEPRFCYWFFGCRCVLKGVQLFELPSGGFHVHSRTEIAHRLLLKTLIDYPEVGMRNEVGRFRTEPPRYF